MFLNGKAEIETQLSFSELQRLARHAAVDLHERCKVGSTIALIMPTSPEFIVAFFACLYAGVIPVPLSQANRHNGAKHLQAILHNAGSSLCLSHESYLPRIVEDGGVGIPLEVFSLRGIQSQQPLQRIRSRAQNVAFLQYTSGSTSAPKGVTVTHGNIVANQKMIKEVFGHDANTRQLNWMPLFHDMGLIGHVMQPIYNGTVSYLMDPTLFVQRPRLWLQAIARYRVTSTGGPNFCYQHCAKRIKADTILDLDLSCLQVAYNGAEPINADVLSAFAQLCEPQGFNSKAFLPCFGLAEATLMVSGIRHDAEAVVKQVSRSHLLRGEIAACDDPEEASALVSVGRVATGETVLIMNTESTRPCPTLQVGEVWISGDNITQGYWHNAQATAETYVWFDGRRYLRSGDLGFLDQDQHLYITGRAKDVIIVDGKNHYPQDIELTAQSVDKLLRANSAAAFSIVDENKKERVILVQELERAYRNRPLEFLADLRERIKSEISLQHALPVADVCLVPPNALAKTTSGKIRRRLVKTLYLQGEFKDILKEEEIIYSASA